MMIFSAEKTVMENGLTVISVAIPNVKNVAAGLIFGTGSLHDFLPPSISYVTNEPSSLQNEFSAGTNQLIQHRNGLAHFSEHLFAHAFPDHTSEEWRDRCLERGLVLNLLTGPDLTRYETSAGGKDYVRDTIHDFAIALHALDYSDEDVELERGRIISEMAANLNDKRKIDYVRLNKLKFGDESLGGQFTGGVPEILANITGQQIRDHHKRMHVGSNATLLVVGNISHEEAVRWGHNFSFMPTGEPYPKLLRSVGKGLSGQKESLQTDSPITSAEIIFNGNHAMNRFPNIFSFQTILNDMIMKKVTDRVGNEKQVYNIYWGALNPNLDQAPAIVINVEDHFDKIKDVSEAVVTQMWEALQTPTEEEFFKSRQRINLICTHFDSEKYASAKNYFDMIANNFHADDWLDRINGTAMINDVTYQEYSHFLEQYRSAVISAFYIGQANDGYPSSAHLQQLFNDRGNAPRPLMGNHYQPIS